ncbi:PA2928 family protein [Crossiella cryophila]|uniref:Uncharacterized protein n=1 Tax=Crossiella cryophila TaxID=43355 RepID=A0A7W7CBW5_9PSEU|nr:PA2928 family protein [Crossiella cryophila]MBB4678340.1 hypothetical protein [Crossiella cryophila]
MKDSSQDGYVWASPGPYEVQRSFRRRKRNGGIFVLVLFSFIGFMVFGMSYFASPYVSADAQKGVGYATVAEKEIALVPYRRSGSRGLFQMITQDTFQVRLFAVELDTGRRLWDTQLSSMPPGWQAKVITAGARNAYVATDGGLVILDLATGDILARDGDIQGLPNPVTSSAAYGYDASSTSIVAMSADGGLRTIPLDTVVAAPAPPELARTWRSKLSPQRPGTESTSGASSSHGVLAGREKVELIPREDVPGLRLVRRTGNSGGTPIGETVFHEGRLLLTPPPGEVEGKGFPDSSSSAAGTPAGLVVVQHLRDLNSRNYAVSVVSVQTGQVVATHPIGPGMNRVLTSPGKRTLLFADGEDSMLGDGLATIGLDGRINWFYLGTIDFFGNPSF